jgi:hypothetical protein
MPFAAAFRKRFIGEEGLMTKEEMQKAMEFIVNQQAQTAESSTACLRKLMP